MGEIVQFVPKSNHNRHILDRIHGVLANVAIPGAYVGGNPNLTADTAPSEYSPPTRDPA